MKIDGITLDQFTVFVMIVSEGSFAGAARRLQRAQSAITYAIQKLEEQIEVPLFDRSSYRPVLTDAGSTLLPYAKRVLDDVSGFRMKARGIVKGLEASVTIVVDAYTPARLLAEVLNGFNKEFPQVQINTIVESFDATQKTLSEGWADIGLLVETIPFREEFERRFCENIQLIAVAAPGHPLVALPDGFNEEFLRDHTQIVLETRKGFRKAQDFGVHATKGWRVADLETKHILLRAGIGWGSMPRHTVAADITTGALVELRPNRWGGKDQMPVLPLVAACVRNKPLGPAARWLIEHFVVTSASGQLSIEG